MTEQEAAAWRRSGLQHNAWAYTALPHAWAWTKVRRWWWPFGPSHRFVCEDCDMTIDQHTKRPRPCCCRSPRLVP